MKRQVFLMLLAGVVIGIALSGLYKHFVTDRMMDKGGMENPFIERPLDGDYTYVDNSILWPILEGTWSSEDGRWQAVISENSGIAFRLDGKTVHHTLTVRNPGTEELRFGIGYHPAFNIPFDAQHTTTDYEFRFDQPESPVILDARPNGLLSGKCYYQWKNQQAIQLTDDLFANDSFCMAGLRTKTIGIYEKGTGRKITCNVEGYPYALIWSAPAKPVRFVCIEPWHSLPAAETDPQQWSQRAAAACLAPGESWETTLSTTFER